MTPIPCSSPKIVPSYCLQHFNGMRGVVKSFDYPIQKQINQEYTVCVETEGGGKEINWQPCGPEDGFPTSSPFSITTVPPETCDCLTDWVAINGDVPRCDNFPAKVSSSWKPFLLNVNFKQEEISDPGNPGNDDEASSCTSNPNLNCEWYPDPSPVGSGTCQCEWKPRNRGDPSALLGPPPDVRNTGFCLKYDVQI